MWGLGVATLNKVKNPSITYSRPSLHPGSPLPIQGTSASMDLTNHRLHGTAAFTTGKKKKKNPHLINQWHSNPCCSRSKCTVYSSRIILTCSSEVRFRKLFEDSCPPNDHQERLNLFFSQVFLRSVIYTILRKHKRVGNTVLRQPLQPASQKLCSSGPEISFIQ